MEARHEGPTHQMTGDGHVYELPHDQTMVPQPYGGPGMLGVVLIFAFGIAIGFGLGAWLV